MVTKQSSYLVALLVIFISCYVEAGNLVSPEEYIKKNGSDSEIPGNGVSFISKTIRTDTSTLKYIEKDIIQIPKVPVIFTACDYMRGGIKAKLIEETGKSYDVALKDHGFDKGVMACVFKYMLDDKVGTQILKSEKKGDKIYQLIFTH